LGKHTGVNVQRRRDDAPAAVALLDVRECECRYLGSSSSAAEKNGSDGSIAKPFCGRGVGRTQLSLRLPQRQPVAGVDALGFRAPRTCDASR